MTPQPELQVQAFDRIDEIDAQVWNDLNAAAHSSQIGSCLLSHAFLSAFEKSNSVSSKTGWQPQHLLISQADQVIAAIPLYAKGHSYGEFVFDWAWADAYQRNGLEYYPKWLVGVPFTPVGGVRLLCAPQHKMLAAQALMAWVKRSKLSSLHVLFTEEADQKALKDVGCLTRQHTQFHWFNPAWADFEAYLASLTQSKRKKIRAERRKVAQAGVLTRVVTGTDITSDEWQFFYRCYANTYHMRGNPPYLTTEFFEHVAQTCADNCVMVIAQHSHNQQDIASALLWYDKTPDGKTRLYGRYWGALEHVDCLHFEVAYYAPIEWAIANGIDIIEGGAQGEHKLARGFTPVTTQSAHWLAHEGFADAVEQYLERERAGVAAYTDSLKSPFRHEALD